MAVTTRRSTERPRALERVSTLRSLIARSGPGLISGASDVDPTTVGAVAVVGSTTVYGLSWLASLLFPMLGVVLVIATRIGACSGRGLQQCVLDRYGQRFGWTVATSIVAVNVLTIAADMHAGGAAIGLLVGHDSMWFTVLIALVVLALLMWASLGTIQRVLKYVLVFLLAYPVAAVLAHPNWAEVLPSTLIPRWHWDRHFVTGALAMLGTTLTSYVYVWQTMQEAHDHPGGKRLRFRGGEAAAGALGTVVVFWFILVATGATLGTRHQEVTTAEEAAQALAPVAGHYATAVFGVGLLVSSLIALPVLLATTGNVIAVQLRAPRPLPVRPRRAPLSTAIVVASVVLPLLVIVVLKITPVRLLVIASVIGGIATPIGLVALMLLSGDRRMLGERVVGRRLRAAGWVVTAVMSAMSLVYLVQQLGG
jgi:Mn2+/Fe2+ NRAMP family transporter